MLAQFGKQHLWCSYVPGTPSAQLVSHHDDCTFCTEPFLQLQLAAHECRYLLI